jgi:hypothetical protein
MNSHTVTDTRTGIVMFEGSGPECFAWQGEQEVPGAYTIKALTPIPAPERTVVSVDEAKAAGVFTPGTWGGETNGGHKIDLAAAADIAGDVAALASGGLAADEAFYAPGTAMLKVGVDRYWTLRKGVESCAPVLECSADLQARVAAERRVDYVVSGEELGKATLDEGGYLTIPGRAPFRLNRKSIVDMLTRNAKVFPGAGQWAQQMGASALASAITDGLRRGGKADVLSSSMFRVRDHSETGERVAWAVLGSTYPGRVTDADQILPTMIRELGMGNARGQWSYDPMTSVTEFTGTWVKPLTVPHVGEIWQGYVTIRTRDDGQGRVWINCGGRRILCINCTEAPFDGVRSGVVHRGSPAAVLKAIIAEGKLRMAEIKPLIERWGLISEIAGEIVVGDETLTGKEALSAMVLDADMLGATVREAGINPDALTLALHSAYDAERATGAATDLLNAITRAAQDRFLDAAQRFHLEQRSGQLVRIFADGTLEA